MFNPRPVRRGRRESLCAAILALLLAPGPVAALEEDRAQPIRITADQALRDEKQGFTVYEGHVEMDQGSLHIEADKIIIFHKTDQADRIVAEGAPAKMQQQPEPDKGLVYAEAKVIEYQRKEERVLLRQNARIEQDGSTVTGDSIDYLIGEQLVRAQSGPEQDGERVQVVIPPERIEQESGDRGETDSE
jgi:lipopolysaccharide export system protein LptA